MRTINKNNCRTGIFEHVFVMTFATRLKFAQIYRIVYGHSMLLYKLTVSCMDTVCCCTNSPYRVWTQYVVQTYRIVYGHSMLLYKRTVSCMDTVCCCTNLPYRVWTQSIVVQTCLSFMDTVCCCTKLPYRVCTQSALVQTYRIVYGHSLLLYKPYRVWTQSVVVQTYRIVYGHNLLLCKLIVSCMNSLLLCNTLLCKFVGPCVGPLMHVSSCSLTFRDHLSVPCLMANIWAA